jgi:subtilase family serine protease
MNKKWIIVIVVAVLVVLVAVMIAGASMFRDITITNVTAPSAGVHGQKIDVSITLKNRGITSTGNFDVKYYLTPGRNMENKTFLGRIIINDLAGRAVEQRDYSLIIPANTTPGNYYLVAYADINNTVKELDDLNNGRFSTNTIVIS